MSDPTARPSFIVALSVAGREALVLGGDMEAHKRARRLHDCGARVKVVWPSLDADFEAWVKTTGVSWEPRAPLEDDFAQRPFVVVSTPRDPAHSTRVAEASTRHGLLLCCVDQPERSNYTHLAVTDAGTVTVALGSGGTAPALLRRLRDAIAVGLGGDFASFTHYLAALRRVTPPEARRTAFNEALAGFGAQLVVQLPKGWRARWDALRVRGLP